MPQPIQAVLFDYGLVLTAPPDPIAWARMKQITRLPEYVFSVAYWAPRLDYDRGHLTGRAYWQAVGHQAALTLTPAQIDDLIAADTILWTQINQPMADWAMRLQAAGTRTGILSNLGDDMTHGVLATFARTAWMAGFHHRLWSHTLKMAKPQPEIYHAAATGLGVPPAAILLVDDREDNIAGALAVGLQAIPYPSHSAFLHEMENRGLLSLWHHGKITAG